MLWITLVAVAALLLFVVRRIVIGLMAVIMKSALVGLAIGLLALQSDTEPEPAALAILLAVLLSFFYFAKNAVIKPTSEITIAQSVNWPDEVTQDDTPAIIPSEEWHLHRSDWKRIRSLAGWSLQRKLLRAEQLYFTLIDATSFQKLTEAELELWRSSKRLKTHLEKVIKIAGWGTSETAEEMKSSLVSLAIKVGTRSEELLEYRRLTEKADTDAIERYINSQTSPDDGGLRP